MSRLWMSPPDRLGAREEQFGNRARERARRSASGVPAEAVRLSCLRPRPGATAAGVPGHDVVVRQLGLVEALTAVLAPESVPRVDVHARELHGALRAITLELPEAHDRRHLPSDGRRAHVFV